jgi:hypothetical protein
MKQFKVIDFWLNIILIILSVVFIYLGNDKFYRDDFEYCLLIVALVFGFTQSFSMIIHILFWKKWRFRSVRRSYMLLAIFVLFYSNFKIVNDWYSMHIYLLSTMVILYTCLCGFEVFAKVKRPLHQLK